jgi:transcriptional regulator with GAF, ATPase, and Fis domain
MASPALAFAQLAAELESAGLNTATGERIGSEVAKIFRVKAEEVAVFKLQTNQLHFVHPEKLQRMGSIPLNTSTSVAARTATSKRAEVINSFAQTKHASVFESVDLSQGDKYQDKQANMIQKLMSAPVVGANGVLGVIQVSRKGKSAPEAGADFTPTDLQKLVQIANSLVKCFK